MEYIVCENSIGNKIKFSDSFPYFLEDYEGIHSKVSSLASMKSAFSIGETYVGRSVQKRNIILYGYIKDNFYERTQNLMNIFPDNEEGTLYYYEEDHSAKIKYRVENLSIDKKGAIRYFTISLICFNPYFEDIQENKAVFSEYIGGIEFPLEIIDDEIEFEKKVNNSIIEIENPSRIDSGLKIILNINGNVKKPTIKNIMNQENLTIDYEFKSGDEITITTFINNKNIILKRDGIETNINNYLLYGTKFLQLKSGINNFLIPAEEGIENILSEIYYSIYYEAI